jgi:hypothetical protein
MEFLQRGHEDLWSTATQLTGSSGFSVTPGCEELLRDFVRSGELGLFGTVQGIAKEDIQPQQQAITEAQLGRELSQPELEDPAYAYEVLVVTAQTNLSYFVNEMSKAAQERGLEALNEEAFYQALQVCPLWPFC